uniref:Uncharacterized protein n=1 Tax=Sphaerodactylus townsendi TaxID=933632 RepID=A0ACB8E892_9SAUR
MITCSSLLLLHLEESKQAEHPCAQFSINRVTAFTVLDLATLGASVCPSALTAPSGCQGDGCSIMGWAKHTPPAAAKEPGGEESQLSDTEVNNPACVDTGRH